MNARELFHGDDVGGSTRAAAHAVMSAKRIRRLMLQSGSVGTLDVRVLDAFISAAYAFIGQECSVLILPPEEEDRAAAESLLVEVDERTAAEMESEVSAGPEASVEELDDFREFIRVALVAHAMVDVTLARANCPACGQDALFCGPRTLKCNAGCSIATVVEAAMKKMPETASYLCRFGSRAEVTS